MRSLCFHRGQYGFGVLFRFEAVDEGRDLALRIDEERRPLNPHIFLAVHAFLFEHIEFFGDGLVFIGQKRVGQIVFFFEFLLCRWFVAGNAEYNRSGALDFLECVAEPARFYRSTWGIGLGEEEQYQVLSAKVLGRDHLALFISQRKLGGFIIDLHRLFS